jgi:tetratricopeptide (TPR) repeat protein
MRSSRQLHPSPDQLARFVRSGRQEIGPLLLHLLSCRSCKAQIRILLESSPLPPDAQEGNPQGGNPYDEGLWRRLDAAVQKAAKDLETARREVQAWLYLFETAPLEKKLELIFREGFHPWAVADRLLQLARTPGAEQETWARVALALGSRLDSGEPGAGLWQDFHAAAHGAMGEALLGKGDFAAAETELALAFRLVPSHDGTEERALLCRRLAHLRREQGRADEAAALFLRADVLAQDLDDVALRAEILLDLGDLYFEVLADPHNAREVFNSILSLPRKQVRPAAFLAIRGLVRVLLHLFRAEKALDVLDEGQRMGWPKDSRESLVLLSLRGRVLLALKRPAQWDLANAFRKLLTQEALPEAALAGASWLRSELPTDSTGFAVALGEIVLAAEHVPSLAFEPFAKLIRTARGGQISAEWLQAYEETLERSLARRRLPYRGGLS